MSGNLIGGELKGCRDTVTVWNKLYNPSTGKDEFVRKTLPVLCRWRSSVRRAEARTSANFVADAYVSHSLVVIIPYCPDYLPYDIWKELDAGVRKRFFTLRVSDLIARGAYAGAQYDITGDSPFTETELKKRLGDKCATIMAFSDNTGVSFDGGRAAGNAAYYREACGPVRGAHYKVGCFYGLKNYF